MKICLCQPPVEDFYTTPDRHYPLGLISLAGYIHDLPVECRIVDFLHTGERETLSVPKNFSPVRPFLPFDTSPVKIFHHYYHFGMAWDEIESFFIAEAPDLIAVSSLFYTYSFEALEMVRRARRACPEAVIVLGGQNVRDGFPSLQEDIPADYAVIGEGEVPFRALVAYLLGYRKTLSNIPGLLIRAGDHFKPVSTNVPNIPCTPVEKIVPDYSLIETGKYTIGGLPSAMIQTSRGCPFCCAFCTIERTFGRIIRYRPVNDILKEIDGLVHKGVKVLDFEDDNLTVNRNFSVALFSGIEERYGNALRLYAMNGLSSWTLDETLLKRMRDAGFVMLNLSIGTLSEKSLKESRRVDSRKDFERAAQVASDLGMIVMGYFIAGLPGENMEKSLETLSFLSRLPVVAGISPFYTVPGQTMDIPRISADPRDARLSRFFPSHDAVREKDLITLFRLTRWVNYVKEKMEKQGIKTCSLFDLPGFFRDDQVITELVHHSRLIGYHRKNRKGIFCHDVSGDVIATFLKRVKFLRSKCRER